MTLTPREKLCIGFLSNKMEATARMVGEACWDEFYNPYLHSVAARAAVILRKLRNKGLVMRVPELKAWRLTREGRDWVERNKA